MKRFSPEDLIRAAPEGTMAYEMLRDQPTVCFMIREDARRVERLDKNPAVEIRAGGFEQDDVLAVAVMFRIGAELYECWFNFCQDGGGEKYFRNLAEENTFVIAFYAPELSKAIRVRNRLKSFFQQMLERAAGRTWSMSEFDAARNKIYARYPGVPVLWNALLPGPG